MNAFETPEPPGCQNTVVSYYRDQSNPDAVHFPACLTTVALFGVLATLLAITAGVVWFQAKGGTWLWQEGVLFLCFLTMALVWPKHILTDQAGIHAGRLFRFRRRFIAWRDLTAVRERREVPLLPRSFGRWLENWAIEVRGAQGNRVIRFTSRHSDRETFLAQIKRWRGVEVQL